MKNIFYLFLMGLIIASCSTDDPILEERVPAFYPVQSKTVGRVLDQNGTPIADAVVELNGQTAITNSLGLFRFHKMELNGAGTQIIVRKFGYFNAFRTFIPNIPTISSMTIYMIERPFAGSFLHNTGGTVSINGGATVSIPPNAVVTETGSPYSGEVIVSAYWLDPSDVAVLSQMPGDLRGFTLDGDLVQLVSYGMMVVELQTPSGDPLNIGNGLTATLTFPLDASMQSSAPGVIPLWSFNETTGYWEEEGTADMVGNNYVAEVTHFSWWNCDAPFPFVDFELCVSTPDGVPVTGNWTYLTLQTGPWIAYTRGGRTNQDGKVFGKIPADEVLELSVNYFTDESGCSFLDYSESIGPFSSPSSMSITLDQVGPTRFVNITGNFVNCDGDPISDGVLITSLNDTPFPINSDGTVDLTLVSCLDDIEIFVYDFETLKQSASSTHTTLDPVNDINLMDFAVCDDLDEYITIRFGTVDETYPGPSIGFNVGCLDVNDPVVYFGLEISLILFTQTPGPGGGVLCYYNAPHIFEIDVPIDILTYDDPGYVEGSYSGFYDGDTVEGEFRVKTN